MAGKKPEPAEETVAAAEAANPEPAGAALLKQNIDKLTQIIEQQNDTIEKLKEVVNVHGDILQKLLPQTQAQAQAQAQPQQGQGQGQSLEQLSPLVQLLGQVVGPKPDPFTQMLMTSYRDYLSSMVTLGNEIVKTAIKQTARITAPESTAARGELILTG